MTTNNDFLIAASDFRVSCGNCDFNVANVQVKNTVSEGLCRHPKNKQSALSGIQLMQITDDFFCPYFLEFQGD